MYIQPPQSKKAQESVQHDRARMITSPKQMRRIPSSYEVNPTEIGGKPLPNLLPFAMVSFPNLEIPAMPPNTGRMAACCACFIAAVYGAIAIWLRSQSGAMVAAPPFKLSSCSASLTRNTFLMSNRLFVSIRLSYLNLAPKPFVPSLARVQPLSSH